MALKSGLRIRFTFNTQGGGKVTKAVARQRFINNFAGTVVKEIAFRYSDEIYQEMAGRLESQFVADARKELVHLAAVFRHHITGDTPSNKPTGNLSLTAGIGRDDVPIRNSVPSWAPRTPKYLAYKKKRVGHNKWWDARGLSAKKDAKYSGMKKNTTADAWISYFGPIRASFKRAAGPSDAANVRGAPALKEFNLGPGHFRVAVGTIQIFALTEITPQMLPALASGNLNSPVSTQGNDSLMAKVRAKDREMAFRLDRRSTQGTYRPTLEPFLAYYLTRSVPAAIANRLNESRLNVRRRRTN